MGALGLCDLCVDDRLVGCHVAELGRFAVSCGDGRVHRVDIDDDAGADLIEQGGHAVNAGKGPRGNYGDAGEEKGGGDRREMGLKVICSVCLEAFTLAQTACSSTTTPS